MDKRPAALPARQSAPTNSVRPLPQHSPVISHYTVPLGAISPADAIDDVATEHVDQNAAAESVGSPERGASEGAPAELRLVNVGGKDICLGCHKGNVLQPSILSWTNVPGRNQSSTTP